MIKRIAPITSIIAALSLATPVIAQNIGNGNDFDQMNQGVQNLSEYVKNLAGFLGYDVTQQPSNVNSNVIGDISKIRLDYGLLISVLIGSRPVDSIMKTFAPSSIAGMQVFNGYANAVFTNPEYSSANPQQGGVTANSLIDQPTYQQDPVSQYVLNMLGTPNDSYCCTNSDCTDYNTKCNLLTQGVVAVNGIGQISDPTTYYTYDEIESLIPQLTINSLTGPLVYSTQAQNLSPYSSPTSNNSQQQQGLQALNQAQAAQDFIRNASGTLNRPTLPSQKDYGNIYSLAMNLSGNTSTLDQNAAKAKLSAYMALLRTYAAQMSVGVSNLYYVLAQRMPQNPANAQNPTSQAMSEFQMATHRLFQADGVSANKTWIEQMNSASSATVQKEMALLLAEINYQLYLNRQMQERIMLTNSIILLSVAAANKPDPSNLTSATLTPSSSTSGS